MTTAPTFQASPSTAPTGVLPMEAAPKIRNLRAADTRRRPQVSGLAILVGCLGLVLVAGPALAKRVEPTQLEVARSEVPEHLLLDVGIEVFEPGLPPGDENALEDEGVYADIRHTEARYLPVQLMDTLQSTGLWGAVRVIPKDTRTVDLLIQGRILESSGLKMTLEIWASDSSGRKWLETRYKAKADYSTYRDGADEAPFQDLFDMVANALLDARRKLDDEQILALRRVTEMRFAEDLAPEIFDGYLKAGRRGRLEVARLPADGDPMIDRIDRIRERDHLLVDTLTQHYTNFSAQVAESYEHWRRYSYEELLAQKKVKKQARTRTILGALAILGAVATAGDSSANGVRDLAVFGGLHAIESGMNKAQEAKMHRTALRELAVSFDSEVAPMLVEVEGETLELTGSAEAQFEEWRQLLQRMFREEMGLPLDPDTGQPSEELIYQTAASPISSDLQYSEAPFGGSPEPD